MTRSGFIEAEDLFGLNFVLDEAEKLARTRPIIAVLAIESTWSRDRSAELRTAIETYGVPVALAVGHANDPFSAAKTVTGLLHLLESGVSVSLMRSDLPSVGALAGGASFGAVGTSSGLRHVFPIEKSSGPQTIEPAVVVPEAKIWVRRPRLFEAVALSPDELLGSALANAARASL